MKKFLALLLAVICFSAFFSSAVYAAEGSQYILDESLRRIPIPTTYKAGAVISYFADDAGSMNQPGDIFIDDNDIMYIADTGNNRIIKCTTSGAFLRVFEGPDKAFNEPAGVYVDQDGDIYVADTKNARVVHMGPDGKLVENFVQPKSEYFDEKYPFTPSKIFIDSIGQLYVLNIDDYHGFTVLKSDGSFKGYIASTKLKFNLLDRVTRFLASAEQKERIDKQLPPTHTNFVIDDYGTLYTTTIRTGAAQVSRFTPVGRNIFPKKDFFGETVADYMMMFVGKMYNDPSFADVTVDENGVISALDGTSGRIYQYDSDGNLLAVFGGTGSWRGKFMSASSIAHDSFGNLYVLDATQSRIQSFSPTVFIQNVHRALALYYDGKYQEALEPWNEIVKIDKNYPIAHTGIAKALLKQGKIEEAMASYKLAGNKAGYSEAFGEYRHAIFRRYFIPIVAALIGLVVLLYFAVRKTFRYKAKAWVISSRQTRVSGFLNSCAVLSNPFDGFVILKRNRYLGGLDYITPAILLVLTVAAKISTIYITHYPLAGTSPEDANFLVEIGTMLIPILTLVCCAYLITSIVKGESTFPEQLVSATYCLLPYILFSIPVALASRIMNLGDAGIYRFMIFAIWAWVVILALVSLSVMNNYGFIETFKISFLTIFAALVIWSIIGLIYILGTQMTGFIRDVYREFVINYAS